MSVGLARVVRMVSRAVAWDRLVLGAVVWPLPSLVVAVRLQWEQEAETGELCEVR